MPNCYIVHTFARIDRKRFPNVSFVEITDLEQTLQHMKGSQVVKYNDVFYQYKGQRDYHGAIPYPNRVDINHGPKTIATFPLHV